METFDQYGLVIIDAHSAYESVNTGLVLSFNKPELPDSEEEFRNILKQKLGAKNYDSFINRRLVLGLNYIFQPNFANITHYERFKTLERTEYAVRMASKGVRELLPNLSNTVLFVNTCYSGGADTSYTYQKYGFTFTKTWYGIGSAWLDKDPISFYGYRVANGVTSYLAENDFCKKNQDTLLHSFFSDGDSTGNAHLFNGTTFSEYPWNPKIGSIDHGPLIFRHFGADNWCYKGCEKTFIDGRDMREYRSVCIGDQTWMAENLKYAGAGGVCYEFMDTLCMTHGRMYRLGELTNYQTSTDSTVVRGLCPEGWHVPSLAEYQKLFETVGGISTAGPKLMAPDYWEKPNNFTDEFDFNLRPGGYYIYDENDPEPYNWSVGGFGAAFWTSSPGNNPEDYYSIEVNEDAEIYAEIIPLYPELGYERGATCRCVKDK